MFGTSKNGKSTTARLYENWKKKDLVQECKRLNLRGYSNRRKYDIVSLLQQQIHKTVFETIPLPPSQNEVLALFYNKYAKKDNDRINKLREDAIMQMFNTEIDPQFLPLKNQFVEIFQKHVPSHIVYDTFILERKAGRGNNYDFAVFIQKNLFTQHTLKVEFKYGNSIFDYPQFISIYLTNRHFSLIKDNADYVKFWYENFFPHYITCAQIQDMIPPVDEYTRTLNSTTYSTNIQKKFYDIMKNDAYTKQKLYKIVDDSIEKYLFGLKLEDIDFDMIENMVRKQMDKIFIFCKNGKLSCHSFDHFTMDRNRYETTKNTLKVFDLENKFVLNFLLRWKNYKGLSGPAWQVGIKKMI